MTPSQKTRTNKQQHNPLQPSCLCLRSVVFVLRATGRNSLGFRKINDHRGSCSIARRRHHDQGSSCKKKNKIKIKPLIGADLQFQRSLHYFSMEAGEERTTRKRRRRRRGERLAWYGLLKNQSLPQVTHLLQQGHTLSATNPNLSQIVPVPNDKASSI